MMYDVIQREVSNPMNLTVTKINFYEVNMTLRTLNGMNFFLLLDGLIRRDKLALFNILNNLDEDNLTRILFERTDNFPNREYFAWKIIYPCFIYCIQKNRQYLIPPLFRIFNYIDSNIQENSVFLDTLLNLAQMVSDNIQDEIIMDIYDDYSIVDYNLHFDTSEDGRDRSVEEKLVLIVANEAMKYTLPYMRIYLSRIDLHDGYFNAFKLQLASSLSSFITNMIQDLGYSFNFNINLNGRVYPMDFEISGISLQELIEKEASLREGEPITLYSVLTILCDI